MYPNPLLCLKWIYIECLNKGFSNTDMSTSIFLYMSFIFQRGPNGRLGERMAASVNVSSTYILWK